MWHNQLPVPTATAVGPKPYRHVQDKVKNKQGSCYLKNLNQLQIYMHISMWINISQWVLWVFGAKWHICKIGQDATDHLWSLTQSCMCSATMFFFFTNRPIHQSSIVTTMFYVCLSLSFLPWPWPWPLTEHPQTRCQSLQVLRGASKALATAEPRTEVRGICGMLGLRLWYVAGVIEIVLPVIASPMLFRLCKSWTLSFIGWNRT